MLPLLIMNIFCQ